MGPPAYTVYIFCTRALYHTGEYFIIATYESFGHTVIYYSFVYFVVKMLHINFSHKIGDSWEQQSYGKNVWTSLNGSRMELFQWIQFLMLFLQNFADKLSDWFDFEFHL